VNFVGSFRYFHSSQDPLNNPKWRCAHSLNLTALAADVTSLIACSQQLTSELPELLNNRE